MWSTTQPLRTRIATAANAAAATTAVSVSNVVATASELAQSSSKRLVEFIKIKGI